MANAADIARLRELISEPDDNEPRFSNARLSEEIDLQGSVVSAAASMWRLKAAEAADLVNTSEAGSSHSFSELHKNALRMAAHFDSMPTDGTSGTRRTRVTKIDRV